jgi:hypothetical protein
MPFTDRDAIGVSSGGSAGLWTWCWDDVRG